MRAGLWFWARCVVVARGLWRLPSAARCLTSWLLGSLVVGVTSQWVMCLSVRDLVWAAGGSGTVVSPDPLFEKRATESYVRRPVTLVGVSPAPWGVEERRIHTLCPGRALGIYLERTAQDRQAWRMLACYGGGRGDDG